MSTHKNPAAVSLGRKGGNANTQAQREARSLNAKLATAARMAKKRATQG